MVGPISISRVWVSRRLIRGKLQGKLLRSSLSVDLFYFVQLLGSDRA